MNGFEDTQRETGMQVTSVVAGCLKPKSPNMVSTLLGSPSADEREQALNSVRRHVRLAQRHTSPVVVLRGTNVSDTELNRESEGLQRELLTEGLGEELKDRMLTFAKKVAERAQPQLEHLCRSLHQLRQEFPETRLALEPGGRPDDILGFDAMGWVLDDLQRQDIGYWHDVGNVHLREQAGLPPQGSWLDTYAGRMHGVHLQDAAGCETGLPPGQGEVDFRLVGGYIPAESARVLEIHPRHGRTQILDSVRFLVEQGF